eukprot:GHVP01015649.1.p1 GENE.GHVP01015649.1~~GHVP01015649.1.p1  ORF type:complete len:158 (-),score=14.56 GHVP01015649.1:646-1119(-)
MNVEFRKEIEKNFKRVNSYKNLLIKRPDRSLIICNFYLRGSQNFRQRCHESSFKTCKEKSIRAKWNKKRGLSVVSKSFSRRFLFSWIFNGLLEALVKNYKTTLTTSVYLAKITTILKGLHKHQGNKEITIFIISLRRESENDQNALPPASEVSTNWP